MLIEWRNQVPVSKQFDDLYYSQEGGLAESQYVYIAGNNLGLTRFKKFHQTKQTFRIAELGFGTGLNFCATVGTFLENAPHTLQLNYTACEKYPLSAQQIRRSSDAFASPLLKEIFSCLLIQYNPSTPHSHKDAKPLSIKLYDDRIHLQLYLCDVMQMFAQLDEREIFDAWYLDGFAPSKNPEMWTPSVFHSMGKHPMGKYPLEYTSSFATFTAAASIRNALSHAGFEVERYTGFGKKRHMLKGIKKL